MVVFLHTCSQCQIWRGSFTRRESKGPMFPSGFPGISTINVDATQTQAVLERPHTNISSPADPAKQSLEEIPFPFIAMNASVWCLIYSDSVTSEDLRYLLHGRPPDATVDFDPHVLVGTFLTEQCLCFNFPKRKHFVVRTLPSRLCSNAFLCLVSCGGEWVANGRPFFYISWLGTWKSPC